MIKILKSQTPKYLIPSLCVLFFLIAIPFNITFNGEEQFAYLANSFLHLKTFFVSMPGSWEDTTFINGHHYWPLGPFPALLITPFVYLANVLGFFFQQAYLNLILCLIIFYQSYLLSKNLQYKLYDSLYWAFAFCCVSPFMLILNVPFSWYFAQTVATSMILLFLHMTINLKSKPWILGTFIALLLATRPFAALACILFLTAHTLTTKKDLKKSFLYLIQSFIASPFFLIVLFLLAYNKYSFGGWLSSGYNNQLLITSLTTARDYGLFSIKHVPGNLYYSLLSLPQPFFQDNISHVLKFPFLEGNPWGTSLFFTSPYLIYLFFIRYNSTIKKMLLSVSLLTYIPILMYYGIGFRQYGYRYALDFFPFLFLLLMIGYKEKFGELNNTIKTLIILFAFINLWFFATIFLR